MEGFLTWLEKNYLKASLIVVALLVLVLGSAIWQAANAADVNVTWTPPTLNTDGSPLTTAGISRYDVVYGLCLGGGLPASTTIQAAANTAVSATVTGLAPGSWCFAIRTVSSAGVFSALSGVVPVTVPPTTPNPPSNFKVTLATVAYELRGYSNGTFRFVQVGTVPLGAQCGADLAGGYASFAGATITKPTTGGIIAAKCG